MGYVLGKRPYYFHLKAFVSRLWKPKGNLDIFTRDNGFVMFNFLMIEDMKHVLEGGPYLVDGRPLVLKL